MKNLFTKHLFLVLLSFTIPIQTKISIPNISTKVSSRVSSLFNRTKEEISHQEFNNVTQLEIICDHGPIVIESWKQPCVLLELKKRGNTQFMQNSKLICPKQNQTLRVNVSIPPTKPSGSVALHVLAPADLPIKIKTANHSVTIKNMSGTLDLETIRGAINIIEGTNTVIAKTVHGNIKIQRKKIQPDQSLNLYSQHGNISLYVPQDINAELEAQTKHGKIYSNLFVTLLPQTVLLNDDTFKKMKNNVEGSIGQQIENSHNATILLRTDFGVIQINSYDALQKKNSYTTNS